MAILVEIDARTYLTDVGFGEFSLLPIEVDLNRIHKDERGNFKITQLDETYLVVNKQEQEDWLPEHRFSFKERQLVDFNERCSHQQTSPDSHFTQKVICSLPTPNGRITLSGNSFTIKDRDKVLKKEIKSKSQQDQILWQHFRIKL